ncbi:MAG: ABC transporter permease, partial [Thermomicrobiales bacterium]
GDSGGPALVAATAGVQPHPREAEAADALTPHRARLRERALTGCSPLLLLVVWEILARAGVLDARFFPAPSAIAHTFIALVRTGTLVSDVRDTLVRVCVGVALGGIPGLVIGAAMGLSRTLRAFLKPVVAVLFPIPKIATLPLILLIFGLGETAKYVSVAVSVVFVMLINTMAGVLAIDDIYLDVGRNYGASCWQFFTTIAIPGALPGIMTGLQLSLTVGLLVCVATEFVGAKTGIGYLIWQSWEVFAVEAMYSGLIACAILGLVFQLLLDGLVRVLIPWQPRLE